MTIGFPAVLKTVRGGYDGKGQWRADSLDEARAAFAAARARELIFERLVPLRARAERDRDARRATTSRRVSGRARTRTTAASSR